MAVDIRSLSSDTKTISSKQASLVSGTNIKTINGSSVLGSGDLVITPGVTYTSGNAISLASNIICVTSVCDAKWSTDTNTTYSADGTTACMTGTVLSVLPACVTAWNGKQSALVSGTSIKTINGTSILGSGDLVISGSGGTTDGTTLCTLASVYSILPACNTKWNEKQDSLTSGTSIKTINGTSLLGSGDLVISGGGSLTNFSESNCTVGLCPIQVILKPNTVCVNSDLILCTKGYGSIASYSTTNLAENTTRSIYSIDLNFGLRSTPGIMCSSDYGVNIGGCNNLISGGRYGTIIGGYYNKVCLSAQSGIMSGSNNNICSSTYSIISGGFANNITTTSPYSSINGGGNNVVNASSNYAFIGSGYYNYISCGNYSGIISGYCNLICGSAASVVGGYFNRIYANSPGSTGTAALFGRCGQVGCLDTTTLFALASGSTALSTITANYNLVFCVDTTGGIYGCKIKLVDGTQGLNKVLVSDANGLASWGTVGATAIETLGTAIASSTTTTIGGSANSVHITGTTTITSFGTGTTGKTVKVIFDGALTLTHNATSLILATGNIITAAGDSAVFLLENGASGYWRMLSYTRKTGMALIPPASVASATSATSSTTARCLTHAVTGYSANSLTCAINANCASIINTVITCGTGWYTSAICNIARGRCAWITNDIYDCSGGGTGCTCHSFGIKDATNANANVSCLIMSKDNLCFIKSDGTSSGNLINSLSGSNAYKALTISNFSFCCIGTAASCPASIKEILCTTLTDTTKLWSSLNCTFTFSCDGCYSLTNYVDYCTLSSNPNITILNCNNESGKTASLIICNTNRAAYAGANGGTISYTSNAVTSIVSHIYTKQSSMNTSCIDIWATDQDSGGNNTTINTTYSCINIHSQSQCGYAEISMQSISGNGVYLSPKISILSSSIFKGLKITGLPTSNPGVSGAVWNNNGVLNIVP